MPGWLGRAVGKVTNPEGINRLNDGFMEKVVARYLAGETATVLSQEFNVSLPAIKRHLEKRGHKMRGRGVHTRLRDPINETAFAQPLTRESAYWAGMLMADGNVGKYGHTPSVGLALMWSDRAHVEAFRDFIGTKRSIGRQVTNGFGGRGELANFRIGSNALVNDLSKLGVTPRKSQREHALAGLDMDPDFWRGVIDGDGSLSLRPKGRPCDASLTLVGGRPLMEQFKAFVDHHFPGGSRQVEERKSVWAHQVNGSRAIRLIRMLYGRPGPVLARKAEMAARIMALQDRPSQDMPKHWKPEPSSPAPTVQA